MTCSLASTLLSIALVIAVDDQRMAPQGGMTAHLQGSATPQLFVPSPLRLQGGRRSETRKKRPDSERSDSESRRSVSPSTREGESARSPRKSKEVHKEGKKKKKNVSAHVSSLSKKLHTSPLRLGEESTEENSSQEARGDVKSPGWDRTSGDLHSKGKKKKATSSDISSYKTPATKKKKVFQKTPDSGRSVRFSESLTSVHEYPSIKQKFCTQEEIERAFQESIEEEMLSSLEEEEKPKGRGKAAPMWEESSSETRRLPKDTASLSARKKSKDKAKKKNRDN
eukprot:461994-Hanusia_phi.AAC.1